MTEKQCTCYAQGLDPEVRFQLRAGAHAETCPLYRPSCDPVDRAHDEAFRTRILSFVKPKYTGYTLHP